MRIRRMQMRKTRIRDAIVCGLLLIAGAALLAGCGTTEAKPLEVTYYYLPG